MSAQDSNHDIRRAAFTEIARHDPGDDTTQFNANEWRAMAAA
jgi:hypothetical protein